MAMAIAGPETDPARLTEWLIARLAMITRYGAFSAEDPQRIGDHISRVKVVWTSLENPVSVP